MSSRCVSSSDAGRAGRKARRVVLRTFLGAAFVTAAGGTLTLAQGWRAVSWLFLIAPALVALIAAVRISVGESQRSSSTAVVPVLWALPVSYTHLELLSENRMTVKEIAYALDFNSSRYFSSFFKKRTGRSPLEYRAWIRRNVPETDGPKRV